MFAYYKQMTASNELYQAFPTHRLHMCNLQYYAMLMTSPNTNAHASVIYMH